VGNSRRLYIASPAIGVNPSDFTLFGEKRLFREADRSKMLEAKRTGKKHPSTYGLPAFPEVPRVKVALQNKPLDFYGFERWVLSSRAKALLEGCDADAFDFVECETTAPPRHSIENYWLGRVRRVVIDFDRDASNFELYGRQYDPVLRRWIVNDAITKLNMLKLKPGSEQFTAFYLLDYHTYPIFDGKLVDAIRDAGFRGLQFSPLQPPIGKEKKQVWMKNYKYWHKKGEI
tara:strand:- start:1982 stop:2674 length:693 start_codon:yes stop_codon:yes gene_type:complete